MNIRRFLTDLGILVLHATASAGLIFCLCYAATGQPLLAIAAGIICVISIMGFLKLEPPESSKEQR